MKIAIVTIGRFKSKECEELFARYRKLAGRFAAIEHIELDLPKNVPEEAAQDQALLRWLEKRGGSRRYLTLLDERGKSLTSREFAAAVGKIRDGSHTEWVVAVGGAHGYGSEVGAMAQLKLSLSPMTLPHELAAVVAAEQLFRALSILAGHPYHNE